MNQQEQAEKSLVVANLKGVDERGLFKQQDGFFDRVEGLYQKTNGSLHQLPGIKHLLTISATDVILSIHQTFDSRDSILIQTTSGLYRLSEAELFGRAVAANLTPVTLTEEEDMSKAIILHRELANVNGGEYTTANVWQKAPLNVIDSQLNSDGTAASFASIASSVITLASGWYRMNVLTLHADASVGTLTNARIRNTTTNITVAESIVARIVSANRHTQLHMACAFQVVSATETFEIQHIADSPQTSFGFGQANNNNGANEIYRIVEIIKTV